MRIIDNFLCNISNESLYEKYFSPGSVFLDIETTGLKRERDRVYLTGLLFKKDKEWLLKLIFAESPSEEADLLKELDKMLSGDCSLITFNGNRFDLPFLIKRYEMHGITPPSCLSGENSDIYKMVKDYRGSFGLSHMNQKSIEKMLGVKRDDRYDGGELIKVYWEYVNSKDPGLLDLLLAHNREDVLGMTEILPVLSYLKVFSDPGVITDVRSERHKGFNGEETAELVIAFSLTEPVIKPHLFHNLRLFLKVDVDTCELRIPLFNGALKHFFDNYKDYYYIPSEDRAVYKEIGKLMDPDTVEKAKAANCYVRKEGFFLPLPGDFIMDGFPVYKTDVKSKQGYIVYSDKIKGSPDIGDYLKGMLALGFR